VGLAGRVQPPKKEKEWGGTTGKGGSQPRRGGPKLGSRKQKKQSNQRIGVIKNEAVEKDLTKAVIQSSHRSGGGKKERRKGVSGTPGISECTGGKKEGKNVTKKKPKKPKRTKHIQARCPLQQGKKNQTWGEKVEN